MFLAAVTSVAGAPGPGVISAGGPVSHVEGRASFIWVTAQPTDRSLAFWRKLHEDRGIWKQNILGQLPLVHYVSIGMLWKA